MPTNHAVLSPSAAERWISCPASVLVEKTGGTHQESIYAAEGTAAHALAELRTRAALDLTPGFDERAAFGEWVDEYGIEGGQLEEMELHTAAYTKLVRERSQVYPRSQVLLEQRLNTGIPECWGTGDAVIVSPTHVEIIDFKYGTGVPVSAEGNPQLRLYALGALRTFGDLLGDVKTVRATVHQPRLDSISTEEMTARELKQWAAQIKPIAEEALKPGAHFGPSETACRWCPIKGSCRARMEHETSLDFDAVPDELTPEEIAELLPRLKGIKAWCDDVESSALDRAYSRGEAIPGWKVVRSAGRRKIVDDAAAIQTLIDHGFNAEEVSSIRIATFGDLESIVGKKDLERVLADYITRTEGSPSLVKETDKRPAISPNAEAMKDFSD